MARPERLRGGKPDKIIRDALILELNRMADDDNGKKVKKVNRIVAKLVIAGMDGKIDAIKEIFDRVEGKATTTVETGDQLTEAIKNHWVRFGDGRDIG